MPVLATAKNVIHFLTTECGYKKWIFVTLENQTDGIGTLRGEHDIRSKSTDVLVF